MDGETGIAGAGPVPAGLDSRVVFVAEDEALVAMDLVDMLADAGALPMPPCGSVVSCMSMLDGHKPDAAILDVRLRDGDIFGVADRLHEMGVALVFVSGHASSAETEARYPGARFLIKPASHAELLTALGDVLASRTRGAARPIPATSAALARRNG